jgi:hypothetical protein
VKLLRILDILPIVLTLVLFHPSVRAIQNNNDTRSLTRLEQKWVTLFRRPDRTVMESGIADDFIYTSETATLSKREFIKLVEKLDLSERRIELTNSRVRVYGRAAVSTGGAVLRPQADDQIKGNSKVTSRSAVINLAELSQQKKTASSSVGMRGVPAPMPVPQDRPVPDADARYRYTAMYIKVRGRWQMVALHLSWAARE